jgi:hypothetical protein
MRAYEKTYKYTCINKKIFIYTRVCARVFACLRVCVFACLRVCITVDKKKTRERVRFIYLQRRFGSAAGATQFVSGLFWLRRKDKGSRRGEK